MDITNDLDFNVEQSLDNDSESVRMMLLGMIRYLKEK